MSEQTATEIENERVELEKELKDAVKDHAIVENEKLILQRQIIELQLKKKDLEIMLCKSMANIRKLNIELKKLALSTFAFSITFGLGMIIQ